VLDRIEGALAPYLPYTEHVGIPRCNISSRKGFPIDLEVNIEGEAIDDLDVRHSLRVWMQRNDNVTAQTTEQKLASIWAGVLAMPAMKFTSGDNFFAFIRSEFLCSVV
jgi:hypothetical protein